MRTFTTKADVQSFKDTNGISPTTQYYYRIRAIVNDGAPNPYTDSVNTFSLADNENVVDNKSLGATITGGWTSNIDSANAIGGEFLTATTSGTKTVTFTPDLAATGTYFIYVHSISGKSHATNATVQLLSDGDVKKTFTVNEQTNNGYVYLGSFKLDKGTAASVRVVNTGANGLVVADAARFQRTSTSAASVQVAASTSSANLFSENSLIKTEPSVVL